MQLSVLKNLAAYKERRVEKHFPCNPNIFQTVRISVEYSFFFTSSASRSSPLFLVLRYIDDADADRFCADGIQRGETFESGGDFILSVGVSGNHDRNGIIRTGNFVLEDA